MPPHEPPPRPAPESLRARDPETPLDELARLLGPYPDDFLLNPVLPLLPVLHGHFFASLHHTLQQRLVHRPRLPDYVLRALAAASPYLLDALCLHPRLPADVLRSLTQRALKSRLTALGEHPVGQLLLTELLRSPDEPADELLRRLLPSLAADPDPKRRAYAAAHPLTDPSLLDALTRDPRRQIRQNAATNPGSPAALRARVAQGSDGPSQAAMTRDPTTDPQHLALLASSPRVYIRAMAAEHPALPPEALAALARDPSWIVRRASAWNAVASLPLLDLLDADPHPSVRAEARWLRQTRPAA